MRGRAKAARGRLAEAVYTAWHVAAFSRSNPKRPLPDLKRIVRRIVQAERVEQTPEEGLRVAEALVRRFGGRDLRGERRKGA